ncbi:hypothetical protein PVL29_004031 [Vitis rotundifolia]|uniref:J domain-containing protein n=1 Tax=Vitis rotundifolia TaxID=103349 RepID=A0AA39A6X3_VITRO|nr:hypothetical protein PVL29_004031 [Vitis rotundifolia]
MAVTSTSATASLLRPNFRTSPPQHGGQFSNSIAIAFKPRRFRIRSSGDGPVETTDESDSKSPVETQKGPPSLISALNVEKALRGIAVTDADHYGRLGLQRECSYDQVTFAYKRKVEELRSQELDEEETNNKLGLLKESYSILSSPKERRLYDWSLTRSEKPDRYAWPFEVEKAITPTEEPPAQEPEDVRPTILVGYFLFAWLILSFTLSIALNR